MSQTSNRGQNAGSPGAITNLFREIQLAWRLFQDVRVPTYAKILPIVLVLIYFLFPLDFIPDPILGLGQLDDLGVFFLGLALFRALIPKHIVQEYIQGQGGVKSSPKQASRKDEDYIDAEYRVMRDDE